MLDRKQLLEQLTKIRFKPVSESDHFVHLQRFAAVHLFIWFDSKDPRFDTYAELSGGLYEYGEIAGFFKGMYQARELLLAQGLREIGRSERLYPENRRGKNTRTSEL